MRSTCRHAVACGDGCWPGRRRRLLGTLQFEVHTSMVDSGKLVKRIQEMRDEGYLSDAILRAMVKEIKVSDDRYNFVGVYLHKPEENLLWLHNYVGEGTDHAKINVGEGVCGTAVAERK